MIAAIYARKSTTLSVKELLERWRRARETQPAVRREVERRLGELKKRTGNLAGANRPGTVREDGKC
jgi:hypothetical protein